MTIDDCAPITRGTTRAEVRRRIMAAIQALGELQRSPGDRPESAFGLAPYTDREAVLSVDIDRARAWRLLSFHKGSNRDVRPSEVQARVGDITSGRFKVTNDLLTFSRLGNGLNGQKRLLAIWLTDVCVRLPVMFGADDDSVYAMDRPERRDLAGDLKISKKFDDVGPETRREVMASARVLSNLAEGYFPWSREQTPYYYAAMKLLEDHPAVPSMVKEHGGELKKRGMPVGAVGALLGLFVEADGEMGRSFVERLFRVGTLPPDDPVYHVVRFAQDHRSRMNLLKNKREMLIRCVRAWDNVWHGRKVTKLVTHLGDGKFPRIAGLRYDRDTGGLLPPRRSVALVVTKGRDAA